MSNLAGPVSPRAELAAILGPDVTEAMLRNCSQRDGLARHRVGGTVYYRLDQAATIERAKRLSGRGRPRRP
ncbi:hypothetical protein C6W10_27855 [Plantactinospora sp. BB1]|nr:hypothetical protein [Plantactinospora sp. BB1]AVT39621.1 hypothetical protein C6W10_27855 [Plantactinospora sp. BB1]